MEVAVADIQKAFIDYHDQIKLGTYHENKALRDKRDLLINGLKESLRDEKIPNTEKKLTFSKIDQGSYSMHTGVKPLDDDYDIDVGVIFDINTDDYDSKKLKKNLFEINSINKIIETFHITDLVLASTMPQAIMLIYLYMPKMAEIYILHGAKKRPRTRLV